MGRMVTIIGSLISILICVAVDLIKDIPLFNIFQSVLSFIAPPMAAVFVMGVFWKRCSASAAQMTLTFGTALCLLVGILYYVMPEGLAFGIKWPHFMLLSFYLFVILIISMVVVSLIDKNSREDVVLQKVNQPMKPSVLVAWCLLFVVMISLYVIFNGH